MVQLRVAGAAETLTITCPSLAEAESLADLIDGYCRLHNNTTTSLWSCKGMDGFKVCLIHVSYQSWNETCVFEATLF